jgi:hypothetical protein
MKIKIIDKCCNEFVEIEIKANDIVNLGKENSMIKIASAKVGHAIVLHPDLTIEYIPIIQPCNLSNMRQ